MEEHLNEHWQDTRSTSNSHGKRKDHPYETSNFPNPKRSKMASEASDSSPGLRQRKKPKKAIANAHDIPRTYDDCNLADKKLINMRDANKSWPEIRMTWKQITGEKTATSTLPNRYIRLKSNFSTIKEEDRPRLLQAKHEIEEAFESEKWGLIAEAVQAKGGDSYQADDLKRQYKKMMTQEGLVPPPGIHDPDFEVELYKNEDESDF